MRAHTTVTITEEWLDKHGACNDGFDAIRSRLPLEISTDPEENYGLACFLADHQRAHEGSDARWLYYSVTSVSAEFSGTEYYGRDAYQTAQWLAWAADAIDVNTKARKRR